MTVTEDSTRPGRPLDDSGYGPSLWTGELGTPDGSRTVAAGANRYNTLKTVSISSKSNDGIVKDIQAFDNETEI